MLAIVKGSSHFYTRRGKTADQRQMKAVPSTGGKTLWGGMFMNAAKDHNHEKKAHQLTVKLEAAKRGNASTAVGFLWA